MQQEYIAFNTLRVQPGLRSLSKALITAKEYDKTVLYLKPGIHDEQGDDVHIPFSITIVGAGKKKTTVIAGIQIESPVEKCSDKDAVDDNNNNNENDSDSESDSSDSSDSAQNTPPTPPPTHVRMQHFTLTSARGSGIFAHQDTSFDLECVRVRACQFHGVVASGVRGTMKNCIVCHCSNSGLAVFNSGCITVEGKQTSFHHNCIQKSKSDFGLRCDGEWDTTPSTIHLVNVQKSEVSNNNAGGGDWGGDGIISSSSCPPNARRVHPNQTNALKIAYETALREGDVKPILFLEKGIYVIEKNAKGWNVLDINIPIQIIGAGRGKTVIVGGLVIKGTKGSLVEIKRLSVQNSDEGGIVGMHGSSFHAEEVTVQQCGYGIVAYGTDGSMRNCQVMNCRGSGVVACLRGTMWIEGQATQIRTNCLRWNDVDYGLRSYDKHSKITVSNELILDKICVNNGGGGDYGGGGIVESRSSSGSEGGRGSGEVGSDDNSGSGGGGCLIC